MELLNNREVWGGTVNCLGRKSESFGPEIVDPFSLMLLETQHVHATLSNRCAADLAGLLKWMKLMKFFNGTARAKVSDGSREPRF